jgi:hypothetical protein
MIRFLLLLVVTFAPVFGTSVCASMPAVVAVSSNAVEVHRPVLQRTAEGWLLTGCLTPQRGVWPSAATHLDIVFCDAAGAALAMRTKPLAVSTLRDRPRRRRPHARYEFALGELPAGTARIEVRAHRKNESHN